MTSLNASLLGENVCKYRGAAACDIILLEVAFFIADPIVLDFPQFHLNSLAYTTSIHYEIFESTQHLKTVLVRTLIRIHTVIDCRF